MSKGQEKRIRDGYALLGESLAERGIDIAEARKQLEAFEVEVPSWVFGEFGGGRFGAYMPPGPARNAQQKIDDAAFCHKLTGAAPRVAIHVGWDKPVDVEFEKVKADDFAGLAAYAKQQGISLGAVNPTLFLKGTYFGSLSSPFDKVRNQLIEHCIVSCEIARKYADGLVTYWLPDGSNYPGQRDLWRQEKRCREAFRKIYDGGGKGVTHLIEYKLFEPGTYSTLISDAGTSKDIALELGDRAGVLVDLGHHAHGVNVTQIVARLIATGIPAGFHFNTRYAADDDHAVEPNTQMYGIFCELVAGNVVTNRSRAKNWAYMIDQCSSLENRVHAILHSIDSLQISFAKALLLDRKALAEAQKANDIIGANRIFLDAFLTDVRPLLRLSRIERGLPADPVEGYRASGYQEKIQKERDK
ncbi:MAG TPA: L-rhamnose isomerase [Candidatus Brocadiia bacterium]|nr:L-rhamnose isomerase [Candidatus Brocadiia bacterium]